MLILNTEACIIDLLHDFFILLCLNKAIAGRKDEVGSTLRLRALRGVCGAETGCLL